MLRLQATIPRALALRGRHASASASAAAAPLGRRLLSTPASIESLAMRAMATAFRQYGHLEADIDPLQLPHAGAA
ncbi:hypothetical protein PINS_up022690 [Pythium insidiosum]|nr:hypothetical protein PINS_up022690 [Pythium insidiosum]